MLLTFHKVVHVRLHKVLQVSRVGKDPALHARNDEEEGPAAVGLGLLREPLVLARHVAQELRQAAHKWPSRWARITPPTEIIRDGFEDQERNERRSQLEDHGRWRGRRRRRRLFDFWPFFFWSGRSSLTVQCDSCDTCCSTLRAL